MADRSHQQPPKHDPRTSEQPNSAPDDGTPTNNPAAALHWAAVALGLAAARTDQGNPLTDDEQVAYDRYQDAARAHGFTDEQIRAHVQTLGRPAVQA